MSNRENVAGRPEQPPTYSPGFEHGAAPSQAVLGPMPELDYYRRGANTVRGAFDPSAIPVSLLLLVLPGLLASIVIAAVNLRDVPIAQSQYEKSIPPVSKNALPPVPFAQVPPYDGDFIRNEGLPTEERLPLQALIADRMKLSADQSLILEHFLADAGKAVFQRIPRNAAELDASVRETGRISAAPDAYRSARVFLVTANGRLEVGEASVTFVENSGKRVDLQDTLLVDREGRSRWTARSLKGFVETARVRMSLTAEQATTVLRYLGEVEPFHNRPFDVLRPEQAFQPGNDSCIRLKIRGVDVIVLPDGSPADPSVYRWGINPVTHEAGQPVQSFIPSAPGSLTSLRLMPYEAAVKAAIAILLGITAVSIILRMRGALRVLHAWCYLHLACSVMAVAHRSWYLHSLPNALVDHLNAYEAAMALGTLLSMSYAVTTLFVIHSQRIQQYLAVRRDSQRLISIAMRWRWVEMRCALLPRLLLAAGFSFGAVAAIWHGMRVTAGDVDDPWMVTELGLCILATGASSLCLFNLLLSYADQKGPPLATAVATLIVCLLALPSVTSADPIPTSEANRGESAEHPRLKVAREGLLKQLDEAMRRGPGSSSYQYPALDLMTDLGETGRQFLRKIADGSDPLVQGSDDAPSTLNRNAPVEQGRRYYAAYLRVDAIDHLAPPTVDAEVDGPTRDALVLAAGSRNSRVSRRAIGALNRSHSGRHALVALYRTDLPKDTASRIIMALTGTLNYWDIQGTDRTATDPTRRPAIAAILDVLAAHAVQPGERGKNEPAGRLADLHKLLDSQDAEVRRLAIMQLMLGGTDGVRLPPKQLAELMEDPREEIASVATMVALHRADLIGSIPVAKLQKLASSPSLTDARTALEYLRTHDSNPESSPRVAGKSDITPILRAETISALQRSGQEIGLNTLIGSGRHRDLTAVANIPVDRTVWPRAQAASAPVPSGPSAIPFYVASCLTFASVTIVAILVMMTAARRDLAQSRGPEITVS